MLMQSAMYVAYHLFQQIFFFKSVNYRKLNAWISLKLGRLTLSLVYDAFFILSHSQVQFFFFSSPQPSDKTKLRKPVLPVNLSLPCTPQRAYSFILAISWAGEPRIFLHNCQQQSLCGLLGDEIRYFVPSPQETLMHNQQGNCHLEQP